MERDFTWEETYEYCHTESMIWTCDIQMGEHNAPCNNTYKRIPVTNRLGEPNCCYTIESLVGQPNSRHSLYPGAFTIELNLEVQGHEYLKPDAPVQLQFKVHNARALMNPFSDGYPLEGGKVYNAYVSMRTLERLPPPYDTNCFDYLDLWRKNNGTGPLNHLMCVENCEIQKLLEEGKCIDGRIDYPHEFKLCMKSSYSLTNEIEKSCTLKCPDACYELFYDVRLEKFAKSDVLCADFDEWCMREYIQLSVIFNQLRVARSVYQPKFENVELFSYIGGYMGMWLGLSLVSLFDFFETICYLLYYPVGRMKAKPNKNLIKQAPAVQKRTSLWTIY